MSYQYSSPSFMSRRKSPIKTIATVIFIIAIIFMIFSVIAVIYGATHPEQIGTFFGKIVNGFNSAK